MDNIASFIDHTALKPDTTPETIDRLCEEAIEHKFASVCVNPHFIDRVVKNLQGSTVLPCVVTGFPLGANTPEVKIFETQQVLAAGAKEVDTVINISALIAQDWELIHKEISGMSCACAKSGANLKVILETCLLNRSQIIKACEIALESGADFVKTSTGFSTAGADVDTVALMRSAVGDKAGVKASGGIKTYEDALRMIKAGASRIGSSSGVRLLKP